jgi:hypothetical protein
VAGDTCNAGESERRASLLFGDPSDGIRSCFAPFLNRLVEYRLDANAQWGFGTHIVPESAVNISATIMVSTQRVGTSKENFYWVHTLEVVSIWQTKSYAKQGSAATETGSMPVESPRFHVRMVQTECDKIDHIIHRPDVSAQALDLARGLPSIILLAIPSEVDYEADVRHQSLHGPSSALWSIRRILRHDSASQHMTHVKRFVNDTRAPLRLRDGLTLPLRDETWYMCERERKGSGWQG